MSTVLTYFKKTKNDTEKLYEIEGGGRVIVRKNMARNDWANLFVELPCGTLFEFYSVKKVKLDGKTLFETNSGYEILALEKKPKE